MATPPTPGTSNKDIWEAEHAPAAALVAERKAKRDVVAAEDQAIIDAHAPTPGGGGSTPVPPAPSVEPHVTEIDHDDDGQTDVTVTVHNP